MFFQYGIFMTTKKWKKLFTNEKNCDTILSVGGDMVSTRKANRRKKRQLKQSIIYIIYVILLMNNLVIYDVLVSSHKVLFNIMIYINIILSLILIINYIHKMD